MTEQILILAASLMREAMELVCFSHIDKSFPVVRDLNGIVKGVAAWEQALLGPSPELPGELTRRLKGRGLALLLFAECWILTG